jgi:hypothetical protein
VRLVVVAVVTSLTLLVVELAAGGLHYGAAQPPRPCAERETVGGAGLDPALQRAALRVLDEVGCRLGRSREQLVLDLTQRGIDVVALARRLEGLPSVLRGIVERLLQS